MVLPQDALTIANLVRFFMGTIEAINDVAIVIQQKKKSMFLIVSACEFVVSLSVHRCTKKPPRKFLK